MTLKAINTVFAAPVKRTSEQEIRDDAITAATCALEMGGALEKINSYPYQSLRKNRAQLLDQVELVEVARFERNRRTDGQEEAAREWQP